MFWHQPERSKQRPGCARTASPRCPTDSVVAAPLFGVLRAGVALLVHAETALGEVDARPGWSPRCRARARCSAAWSGRCTPPASVSRSSFHSAYLGVSSMPSTSRSSDTSCMLSQPKNMGWTEPMNGACAASATLPMPASHCMSEGVLRNSHSPMMPPNGLPPYWSYSATYSFLNSSEPAMSAKLSSRSSSTSSFASSRLSEMLRLEVGVRDQVRDAAPLRLERAGTVRRARPR